MANNKLKPSNDFIAIEVCLTNGDSNQDKKVTGFYRVTDIAGMYPGYSWGTIVILHSGTTFLTTATCAELFHMMNTQSIAVQTKPNASDKLRRC